MDIRDFVEQRLAEDEAVALHALHPDAVKPGEWITEHHDGDPPVCHIAEDRAGHYWSVAHAVFVPNAEHMSRHDPARVLREVAAKRQILAVHPLANEPGELPHCETCRYIADPADPEPFAEAGYPCPTVRLLALPFAGHPDYRQEWAL